MTQEALAYINGRLKGVGIPYAFLEWEDEIPETYFVGSYIETDSLTREENGKEDSVFILRGYSRAKDWMEVLENAKKKIRKALSVTDLLHDGSGIALFYENGEYISTLDADWHSIKININVQEWRVD